MNTMALDVPAPVFAATHYPSLLQELGPAANSYRPLSEDDYLVSFLDENAPHVLDVTVGDSGTGKSHFIRWLYNRVAAINAAKKNRWCVKLIPRSSANLADVVSSLLDEFTGESVTELKRELINSGQKTTTQGAAQRVLNEYAVLLDPANHQGPIPEPPADVDVSLYRDVMAMLPAFLYDTAIRKWLVGQSGGIVARLAQHATGRRDQRTDVDGLEARLNWTEADLQVLPTVSSAAGRDARELATTLLNDDEARALAARILNDAFSDVLNNLLGLKRGDLRRAMREMRCQLREQRRELVLLIEDMSVTHGLDQDLLEALFVRSRDEVGGGGEELCRLRAIVGMTNEDYGRLYDNVRLGRVRKTLFFNVRFALAAQGQAGVIGRREVTDFASRYLNAARYGIEELEKWFSDPHKSHDLASFCDTSHCPNLDRCHEAFGHVDRRGLYPFTEDALGRFYEKAASKAATAQGHADSEGKAFRPRLMVADVLNYVLEEAERTLPRRRFPSVVLTQSFGLDPVGSGAQVAIEEQFRDEPVEAERAIAALQVYAEQPQTGCLKSLLCEAFDLPCLGTSRGPAERLTLTFEGTLHDLHEQLRKEHIELSIPTQLESTRVKCSWIKAEVSTSLAELIQQLGPHTHLSPQGPRRYAILEHRGEVDPYDRWAAGRPLEQSHVNEARVLLYGAISGFIDWDQQGLAALSKHFERRYINFEGQVVRAAAGGLVVLGIERSAQTALALRGLRDDFRGKTEEESFRMVEQTAWLVRRLADEVVAKLQGIAAVPGDPLPLEVAAQYLAMGAVVRGELLANTSDGDAIAATLKVWGQPSESIAGSPAWQSLWTAYAAYSGDVREWLRQVLTCSKGARVGDCINPTPVMSAVRQVRASGLACSLPATADQWGNHFAPVRRLAEEVQRRVREAIREERVIVREWLATVNRLVRDQDWTHLCKATKKVVEDASAEELLDGAFARTCERMAKLSGRFASCISAARRIETPNKEDDGDDLRALAQIDRGFLSESQMFLDSAVESLSRACKAAEDHGFNGPGDVGVLCKQITQRIGRIASTVEELQGTDGHGADSGRGGSTGKRGSERTASERIQTAEDTVQVMPLTASADRSLEEWLRMTEESVRRHREARRSSQLSSKLKTRLDELLEPETYLGRISVAVQLLRPQGLPPLNRKCANRLEKLRGKLLKLSAAFAEDPTAITQPDSLPDTEWTEAQELGEAHVLEFWKTYVMGALPSEGVLATFEKHAKWTPTVQQIRKLKSVLVEAAKSLPPTEEAVQAVRQNAEAAQKAFAKLPDLSDKVKQFLQQTVSPGVPLRDILGDPEIMKWIKEQRMDGELRVTSGQAGSLPARGQ